MFRRCCESINLHLWSCCQFNNIKENNSINCSEPHTEEVVSKTSKVVHERLMHMASSHESDSDEEK